MTVAELANKSQDLAHEGWSHHQMYIRVYDALYKIKDIHKSTTGNEDEKEKVFFELEAVPLAER